MRGSRSALSRISAASLCSATQPVTPSSTPISIWPTNLLWTGEAARSSSRSDSSR